MKIRKKMVISAVVTAVLLSTAIDANAGWPFKKKYKPVTGCVEAADGQSHGHYEQSAKYFLGIRISKWSEAEFVYDGAGPCPE